MRADIVTIFPGFFRGPLDHGITRRAQEMGLAKIEVHDLRQFTHDRHRTVDDRPFGGGEGMVLKPEPIAEALASLGIDPKPQRAQAQVALAPQSLGPSVLNPYSLIPNPCVALLSAQGRPWTQSMA